ncbi:TPA: DUF551 domain-containing protein [Klebsiella variicola subsp. variicola]|nr:DUF551 domain-containing protein [Klebsiella variicola subsp. variicola]HCM6633051.1 DUF551 domain-containing protein [Klebsiella variicola subsp. variicola]
MDSEPVGSISIDRLLQLLYQFDGANECAASIGDQEYALECGDVASALRELLSCRSALPVADVVAWSNPNEERKCDIRWRRHDVEPGPLYRHAQPAPVVLDEVTAEDCPAFVNYDVTEVDEAWARGFNSCRAAMLAAAPQLPGSELATVPGKWIPVSERMPEIGDIVLTAMGGVVNVGEMECSAANCRFFTSVISGRELPATHWMPMPTAPQEVK